MHDQLCHTDCIHMHHAITPVCSGVCITSHTYCREEIHYGDMHPVVAAHPEMLDQFEWDATSMRRIAASFEYAQYAISIHI